MGYVCFYPPTVPSLPQSTIAQWGLQIGERYWVFPPLAWRDKLSEPRCPAWQPQKRSTGRKLGENPIFLVFRWIPASTGTKYIKPEEQGLCTMMHKGWVRNFKEGCQWVGRCQWERDRKGRLHLQPASEGLQHSLQPRTGVPKAAEQGQQGPGAHTSCYSPGREPSYPSQANLWVLLFTNATKNITTLTNLLFSYLSSNLDTEELCGKFLFGH